ncbi:MAG: prepilin-type N-terminal cleavage/methylation domain-containing protein [Deltaproteobacteria bacterium]|nr:prepilin-type N-terminal cleavage/methylation domain-containing protein [Deltaproteobacteria bacterium]MBW2446233.1 prepilin-type N-terminal cleavage/methylation domain-containing protein [Deltaproteobacteria bacterium]
MRFVFHATPRLDAARARRSSGFTLVELMLVLAAIGVLTALAIPAYHSWRDRVTSADAAMDISGIAVMAKSFHAEFGSYPARLTQAIQAGVEIDPWGNPYVFLAIEGAPPSAMGQVRKDKNLVPINSDFDLYSLGPDGESRAPLAAKVSQDDIVRASDGAFIGLAEEF